MSIFEAIILGIIQGLTEFLPVSSSGHLVIAQQLLGIEQPGVTFEVMVHFGTLFSVIWIFFDDIVKLCKGIFHDRVQKKLFLLLAVSLVPTGIIGLIFKPFFESIYDSYITVGFMLLGTGLMLKAISLFRRGTKDIEGMRYADALFISFAQGIAIIPGISRSGATITAAMARKLDIATAVKFSFLMSVPAILGATAMEAKDLITDGFGEINFVPYLIAALFAFLAGLIAIKTFIRLLKAQKFYYFSYYCWFVGAFVIITALLGF